MNHPICLGDATSSGGKVIECQLSGPSVVEGQTFAVVGDKATCPLHGGVFAFIEGDSKNIMNGLRVVMQGHRLACGCHAIARHAESFSVL
ncbi:PAAR domain-containing protein [Pseudomonas sp. NFR16]|uniref:PAAR domain-containing protein n=1 Tax=Pseudomonas sp. NFR16 TaxID=1566248 RepID=UPI0008C4C654|nr:PAAR domain-containing protein [Pseudomonas sp. NFR16]SEJ81601.1 Zn-binding Pro-Ala-Ala-Arg (PAAR) domain-containing protein, incolved in TypeVI secretion [Pseudomonas sp. NFR16]